MFVEKRKKKIQKQNVFPSPIDSYIEITRFHQGYVDNEVNLNVEGNCQQTCSDYINTKHYHCGENTLCRESLEPWEQSKFICRGAVHNCQYFDGDLSICPAVS